MEAAAEADCEETAEAETAEESAEAADADAEKAGE